MSGPGIPSEDVFNAIASGAIVAGGDGRIVQVNDAARVLFDMRNDDPAGLDQIDLCAFFDESGAAVPDSDRPVRTSLRTGAPVRDVALRVVSARGQERWLLCAAVPLTGAADSAAGVIGSFVDITERKRIELALARQALHDDLTGLPNRVLLAERLAQGIAAMQRQDSVIALLLLDLDRFKEVNDTFGHHVGDVLLQQVGRRFRETVRETDTVSRLGGDEFAVLVTHVVDAAAPEVVARKILRCLREPFEVDGHVVSVQASIGGVIAPRDGTDVGTLMRRADIAMYAAKRAGAGYTSFTSDQDSYSPALLTLASELSSSIERDELSLHFQPKVDMGTGECVGSEALLRWKHPTRGPVSPGEFIPVAEKTGFIRDLSIWVLRDAMRRSSMWQRLGLRIPIAVNLSVRNLQSPELLETLIGTMEIWDVPPGLLTIEVTESALMADPDMAIKILQRMRKLGVRVSIDDFGTGYSSLAYLQRLPADELKIDRSFISAMLADAGSEAIVRSTIQLGHSLGLKLVAEGIENEATWNALRSLGCDHAQGYYIARPMPAEEFRRWAGTPRAVVGAA